MEHLPSIYSLESIVSQALDAMLNIATEVPDVYGFSPRSSTSLGTEHIFVLHIDFIIQGETLEFE